MWDWSADFARVREAQVRERDFFIDNLLVRIHYIIVMIRWTGLAPWEFQLPFPGSLTSTFLAGAGAGGSRPAAHRLARAGVRGGARAAREVGQPSRGGGGAPARARWDRRAVRAHSLKETTAEEDSPRPRGRRGWASSHTHSLALSMSLSLSHTHSLSEAQRPWGLRGREGAAGLRAPVCRGGSCSLSLSLSLSHTHTHTHTHSR